MEYNEHKLFVRIYPETLPENTKGIFWVFRRFGVIRRWYPDSSKYHKIFRENFMELVGINSNVS